jgi:hypothetical protein
LRDYFLLWPWPLPLIPFSLLTGCHDINCSALLDHHCSNGLNPLKWWVKTNLSCDANSFIYQGKSGLKNFTTCLKNKFIKYMFQTYSFELFCYSLQIVISQVFNILYDRIYPDMLTWRGILERKQNQKPECENNRAYIK